MSNSVRLQECVVWLRTNTLPSDFYPANHSVARAEYLYPCIPYELVNPGKMGFFSGFHPVDAILSDPPTWQVKINDSLPIFYYCTAPGSCIDYQVSHKPTLVFVLVLRFVDGWSDQPKCKRVNRRPDYRCQKLQVYASAWREFPFRG